MVRRITVAYCVAVRIAPEARGDRLIPLWSQAWLQALRAADGRCRALAVVATPGVPPRVAEQVLEFAAKHVPGSAVGVVDLEGVHLFQGEHLEDLNLPMDEPGLRRRPLPPKAVDLFSDLNQWMLKVLLAPLIPLPYRTAPRAEYTGAPGLASAAGVSPVSAFRLVRQLRQDGHIDENSNTIKLVRREALLRRWQAAVAARRTLEIPMRFLLRGDARAATKRLLGEGRTGGCLALFAAADALGVGFVHGVPPQVHMPRLDRAQIANLKGVVPTLPGESPDMLLLQPNTPKSVFRGMVHAQGVPTSDPLQVWLDVASQPARGAEQASQISRHPLLPLFAE